MCILFFEPLCSFYEIPAGVLRGTGHSLSPAIAAIIGTCCFRIIWIYTIFGEYCQLSVLYYAFPISWILTIVLIMIDFAIVIKNRQPLKQNFMLNCKETMVKKKRIVIRIAFCDFALWNSDHRNLGLVFPSSCFSGQNGMLSATEQNQTNNNSFFLEDRLQFSSISSAKAASMSPANYYLFFVS